MLVRARDPIYRMQDLKGKKIGLSKSLNMIKNDWWRIQEEQGIELMLMLNDMTRDDVEIVEFPYPDDWYDKPEMLVPRWRTHLSCGCGATTSTTCLPPAGDGAVKWCRRCHLQPNGTISDSSQRADRQNQGHRRPVQATRTGRLQGANVPADHHLHAMWMPRSTPSWSSPPEGLIKVGRWANEHKHAAAVILNNQTYLPGCRGHL